MRPLIAVAPALLGLILSACAAGTGAQSSYASDERRLAEDCRARGGILVPTGQQTGRPQTDNVCEIRGQAARAPGG
jgi:hypothetical protein